MGAAGRGSAGFEAGAYNASYPMEGALNIQQRGPLVLYSCAVLARLGSCL